MRRPAPQLDGAVEGAHVDGPGALCDSSPGPEGLEHDIAGAPRTSIAAQRALTPQGYALVPPPPYFLGKAPWKRRARLVRPLDSLGGDLLGCAAGGAGQEDR